MLPVKLNIMPLTTAIMPQFIYNFIIAVSRLAYLGTRLSWFNFTYIMLQHVAVLSLLTSSYYAQYYAQYYAHEKICASF